MATQFSTSDPKTNEELNTLNRVLNETGDLFKKNAVCGVFIGYRQGGAGGSHICMDAPYSRINISDHGSLIFGPFLPSDLDSDSPMEMFHENLCMVRGIEQMLEDNLAAFRAMSGKFTNLLDQLGLEGELEMEKPVIIPGK